MPAQPDIKAGQNGFSLIEVMVALAIFGLAAVALVRLTGVSLASATTLADRQHAAIVARNQALEAMLGAEAPTPASGRERAGRRDWAWQRQTTPGPLPGSTLVAVAVLGDGGQVIARHDALWRQP